MSNADNYKMLKLAEKAWINDNLDESTKLLSQRYNNTNTTIQEKPLNVVKYSEDIKITSLKFKGYDTFSNLLEFKESINIFDIGVPIKIDGTFLSREFAHLKYPERYEHLFSPLSGDTIKEIQNNSYRIKNAYLTLIRKPYYHWLLDTIPHLLGASYLRHLDSIKLINNASNPLTKWQKQLLEKTTKLFGINNLLWQPLNGNIIGASPGFSQTRMPLDKRLSILKSFRSSGKNKKPWRFIYAKRNIHDNRKLLNENEVISALGNKFQIIEPGNLDIDTQIDIFAEAKCIVGVCGSNLANIVFCQPKTLVVEISAGLPQMHFEKICKANDLQFKRISGNPSINQKNSKSMWNQVHSNLVVDAKTIKSYIESNIS